MIAIDARDRGSLVRGEDRSRATVADGGIRVVGPLRAGADHHDPTAGEAAAITRQP